MNNLLFSFLLYFLELFALTLGVFFVCGLAVQLCSSLFSKLLGHGAKPVYYATAAIGTPIHELGHAAMCLLFGHKIEHIRLWSPSAENGKFGYVEHSYNRKSPWAVLGNLFIGLGPLFSGLGVIIFMLWLCLPSAWNNYLITSRALLASNATVPEILLGVFDLFKSIPAAVAENPFRACIGLCVILPVSLHVKLSPADIRGSLGALPIYAGMLAVFAIVTFAINRQDGLVTGLALWNLRVFSVFVLVIAFAFVWDLLALLLFGIRKLIRCF